MSFNDAIEKLRNGSFVRRKSWKKGRLLYLDEYNNILELFTDYSYHLNFDDYDATDWVFYEERDKINE